MSAEGRNGASAHETSRQTGQIVVSENFAMPEHDAETVMRVRRTGETASEKPRRYCRKCLTREMGRDEYFHSLHEYIENLDADLKVSPAIYEARLAKCKQCEKLLDGMCRICGCYVELRAAMKKNRCPLVRPAWERVQEEDTY